MTEFDFRRIDDKTRLIRLRELLTIVGMGKTAIYDGMKNQSFPRPIKLGKRSVAWLSSDITNFIKGRGGV